MACIAVFRNVITVFIYLIYPFEGLALQIILLQWSSALLRVAVKRQLKKLEFFS